MTEAAIKDVVLKLLGRFAPEANLEELSPDANLREALDIDSFDFLNFLIAIHENLKIEVPESDYDQVATLGGVLRYLAQRLPKS
jgi:acyl carrier protein